MGPTQRVETANQYGISEDRWVHIRSPLVFYFAHHYSIDPEELAQETLSRVVRKLSEGQSIEGDSGFEKFCFACARHVLQESRRTRVGAELAVTIPAPSQTTIGLNEFDFNVLTGELLERLDDDERELATHAIQGTLDELAEQSGVTVETVRVRASRLREKLRRLRDGET
jgi:RNA polymerase sigma factor (sigma-70 family)